jgi:hypothetical protein
MRVVWPRPLMHWIQAKKSHEDGQPIIKVKVAAVHDDGRVEIEGDDLKLTLWYHDPGELRTALRYGGRAEWRPKYHVLYVISGGSFNLATLDQVEPCKPPVHRRPTETTRQFIERAMRENQAPSAHDGRLTISGHRNQRPQQGDEPVTACPPGNGAACLDTRWHPLTCTFIRCC